MEGQGPMEKELQEETPMAPTMLLIEDSIYFVISMP